MDDLREHIYASTGGRRNLSMAPKDRNRDGAHAYEPARDLEKLPVRIRPAEPGDVHMIYDSWLNSYASQNKDQPKWALFPMQRTVDKARTDLARNEEDLAKKDRYGENQVTGEQRNTWARVTDGQGPIDLSADAEEERIG